MKRIEFSTNWNNKLSCNIFSTIRLSNYRKYSVGEVYEIWLNGRIMCNAKIVLIETFLIHELSQQSAMLDTGYSLSETVDIMKRMYPTLPDIYKQPFMYIILKREKTESAQLKLF